MKEKFTELMESLGNTGMVIAIIIIAIILILIVMFFQLCKDMTKTKKNSAEAILLIKDLNIKMSGNFTGYATDYRTPTEPPKDGSEETNKSSINMDKL